MACTCLLLFWSLEIGTKKRSFSAFKKIYRSMNVLIKSMNSLFNSLKPAMSAIIILFASSFTKDGMTVDDSYSEWPMLKAFLLLNSSFCSITVL